MGLTLEQEVERMPIGTTIRELRKKQGLTQGQLATKAQLDRSYLSQIETGIIKEPATKVLLGIAEALRITPDALFAMAGYRPKTTRIPTRTPQEILKELEASTPILVPETTQPASAGAGISVEAEMWPYLPEPTERGHRFIAVPVSGDCMEPTIRAGHKVIVDLDASPKHGDIVLAIHDGESLVKILEKRNDDAYLVALKKRPPLKVDEGTRVLGVVRTVTYRPK